MPTRHPSSPVDANHRRHDRPAEPRGDPRGQLMSTFVFVYHGPTETPTGAEPSEADMKAAMDDWMAWAGKVGDAMTDFGNPLGGGMLVSPGGVAPSGGDITGYTILTAPDMAAALALAEDHPHLATPGGCTIEVLEASEVPGM